VAPSIEIVIGRRIRQVRTVKGLSQARLAQMLGISFQQVQKYESGQNRIAAGRLWEIANALDTPVALFFTDPGATRTASVRSDKGDETNKREATSLATLVDDIADQEVRDAIAQLLLAYHGSRKD
jgi:transcriptional regulator with XRE-family HTH domain